MMLNRTVPALSVVLSVLCCCTVLNFTARADITTVDPGSIGLDAAKLSEVRQAIAKDVADGKLPGAVMLIARRGKVGFFEAAGFQTPQKKRPMTSKTIFRMYSMTKPIVSVAAMSLVEEGRLRLDEPISSYIPYFAETTVFQQAGSSFMIKVDGARPALKQITVRDLMRHTSGMIYGVFDKGALGKMYKAAGAASSDIDLNQFSDVMAKLPLRFEPGTAWHYGRSTDVLGRVIEIAAGQPLDEFLAARIFRPLGMTDTAFFHDADKAGRIAQGVKPLFNVTEPKPMLSGGGGLTSTMEDYLRFTMMLRNRGSLDGKRIIKPETLALMTQNHIAGLDRQFFYPGKAYGFGLGFAVRIGNEGAHYPGTLGDFWWRGYAGTYFWVDPCKDLFAILLIQDPAKRRHYTVAARNWVYNALVD